PTSLLQHSGRPRHPHSFPTRRSSDLAQATPALEYSVRQLALDGARTSSPANARIEVQVGALDPRLRLAPCLRIEPQLPRGVRLRSEEHTSELQSRGHLVCRLLLEKKK